MKKLLLPLIFILFFTGCGQNGTPRGMALRQRMNDSNGCAFTAEVRAYIEKEEYVFSLDCESGNSDAVTFTVTAPASLSGITGNLSSGSGSLTFDGQALAFPMLAQGTMSPISSVLVLLHALRGGYLTDEGKEGLTIDETYQGVPLRLSVTLNDEDMPAFAEIFQDGERILSLTLTNFRFL